MSIVKAGEHIVAPGCADHQVRDANIFKAVGAAEGLNAPGNEILGLKSTSKSISNESCFSVNLL